MASSHHIPSFPSSEDRNLFGSWLSGFTDGEGSFILSWRKTHKRSTGIAKFVIALREDDQEILAMIQSFLGCGTIHSRINGDDNPQCRLVVSQVQDLVETVIPVFERYPLRAKKRRDVPIWRQGVELIYRVSSRPMTAPGITRGFLTKWTDHDISEFAAIAEHLNRQRKYGAIGTPPLRKHSKSHPRDSRLFDFDLDADLD